MNNEGSFGEKLSKKFNIGDLVCWTVWKEDENGKFVRGTAQGILTNIVQKYLGEREVTFACVLPMKSNITVEIVITNIRKLETN